MITIDVEVDGRARTLGFKDSVLDGTFDWKPALDACRLYQEDGQYWRLPTVAELQALVASGKIDLAGKVLFSRETNADDHSAANTVDGTGAVSCTSKTGGAEIYAIPVCIAG